MLTTLSANLIFMRAAIGCFIGPMLPHSLSAFGVTQIILMPSLLAGGFGASAVG
jgi:hypothetical protein